MTDVQRPTPPLTDFDKQVAQFNEVMAMSDEEVERLANKVRSLGATPPLTEESTLVAALKQFGWEGGPEFFRRYYSDPWVFNLANAVERLTAEVARLRGVVNRVRDAITPEDEPRRT